MSKKEIESLVEQMNNYDELAAKVKAKADAIREAIKAEMVRLDVEELEAGAYILRYTSVISNRFDTTTFKGGNPLTPAAQEDREDEDTESIMEWGSHSPGKILL